VNDLLLFEVTFAAKALVRVLDVLFATNVSEIGFDDLAVNRRAKLTPDRRPKLTPI
jgi:hypothetical protein